MNRPTWHDYLTRVAARSGADGTAAVLAAVAQDLGELHARLPPVRPHCPTCGLPWWRRYPGFRRRCRCPNGHAWHRCAAHGVTVAGRVPKGVGRGECSCPRVPPRTTQEETTVSKPTAMQKWFNEAVEKVALAPVPLPADDGSGLPFVTHQGTLDVPNLGPIRVYQLNDGRRILDADDVHALFAGVAK